MSRFVPNPATPPVNEGDWAVEKEARHPDIGRVREVYWDDTAGEWVMNLVLYSPDGDRIGRKSPRRGGPSHFEPAVPVQFWTRIEKPRFPLKRDHTGYRDWAGDVDHLPMRSAVNSSAAAA